MPASGGKTHLERRAERVRLFGELIQRASDGSLTLPVEATHSLEDVRAAAAANALRGRAGKILLRP